ncbi:hypothetical protein HYR99_14035 [Candidatus Poribacteria bacterium]|nr:hypothetical protein [Candidatus Poribacteria bacterium]
MSVTIAKLKSLEKFLESGIEDLTVQMTIDKIMEQKIEEERKSMRHLKRRLRRFERKYKIASEEFYERFSKGELGDSKIDNDLDLRYIVKKLFGDKRWNSSIPNKRRIGSS